MTDFTNIDGVYAKDTELRSGIDTLRTTVLSNTIKPLTVTKNGTYTAIPSSGTYGYSPIVVDTGIYTGTSNPSSDLGKNGDYYYKLSNSGFSLFKTLNPTSYLLSSSVSIGASFVVYSDISVKKIKSVFSKATNAKYYIIDLSDDTVLYESDTIQISSSGLYEHTLSEPLNLGSGYYIVWCDSDETANTYNYVQNISTRNSDICLVVSSAAFLSSYSNKANPQEVVNNIYLLDIEYDTDAYINTAQYQKQNSTWIPLNVLSSQNRAMLSKFENNNKSDNGEEMR